MVSSPIRDFEQATHMLAPSESYKLESVYVVYSNFRNTQIALQYAAGWAAGLTNHIWLVVDPGADATPYSDLLEAALCVTRWFRNLARSGSDFHVAVALCPENQDVPSQLPEGSVVIIAGPKHWRKSGEEKLAARIQACGHQVLFVDTK